MEKERIKELAQAIANINKQTHENLMSPEEAEDQILDLLLKDGLFGLHHMDEIDSLVQQILKEN